MLCAIGRHNYVRCWYACWCAWSFFYKEPEKCFKEKVSFISVLPHYLWCWTVRRGPYLQYLLPGPAVPLTRRLPRHCFLQVMTLMTLVVGPMLLRQSGSIVDPTDWFQFVCRTCCLRCSNMFLLCFHAFKNKWICHPLLPGPAVPLTRRFQRLGKKLVMTLMTWVVDRMLLLGSGNIVTFCFFCIAISFARNLTACVIPVRAIYNAKQSHHQQYLFYPSHEETTRSSICI
jgi:hypothetical protein